MSDQELQALLSQKDIATSLAEDLLKHFGSGGEELDVKEEDPAPQNNNNTLSSGPFSPSNLETSPVSTTVTTTTSTTTTSSDTVTVKPSTTPTLVTNMTSPKPNPVCDVDKVKQEVTSSDLQMEVSVLEMCEPSPEMEYSIDMDSKAVLESCKWVKHFLECYIGKYILQINNNFRENTHTFSNTEEGLNVDWNFFFVFYHSLSQSNLIILLGV